MDLDSKYSAYEVKPCLENSEGGKFIHLISKLNIKIKVCRTPYEKTQSLHIKTSGKLFKILNITMQLE